MPSEKTIQSYFAKAKKASEQATYPKQKIGSVMAYSGKVIAVGYNTFKTNPLQKYYNKYRFSSDPKNNGLVHAETMLLLKTRFLDLDWNKVSIYTYREYKDGSLALARPCIACQTALEERGIINIYYTTPKGWEKL